MLCSFIKLRAFSVNVAASRLLAQVQGCIATFMVHAWIEQDKLCLLIPRFDYRFYPSD
jgi:hypothetical protein